MPGGGADVPGLPPRGVQRPDGEPRAPDKRDIRGQLGRQVRGGCPVNTDTDDKRYSYFPIIGEQNRTSIIVSRSLSCLRSSVHQLSSDKYCLDKLLMSHNFSHIYQGDVAHFAYVCLNMEQSVSEIVETVVYPIGKN